MAEDMSLQFDFIHRRSFDALHLKQDQAMLLHQPMPQMPIMISPYRLRANRFVNAISNRMSFDGVLLEINGGYGCIHPWPELGDPPLDRCLTDLAGERRWAIVRRALRCIEFDRAAREHDESLFEEMEIPRSHATLSDASLESVSAAVEAGFDAIKIKCGRDLKKEAEFLTQAAKEFSNLSWRLDFNESLDAEHVAYFLDAIPSEVRTKIDFLEDPCPYADGPWRSIYQKYGIRLAVDHEAAPGRDSAHILVVKPAVDEPMLLAEAADRAQQRLVVTSYMDHPLGQAFAAWEAARIALEFPHLLGTCGLQTHTIFKPDAFTEALGPWSPNFQVPAGTGLGFDDQLHALPWTPL
ncbi:MAG: hypothetical protein EAZ42_02965 [Verrucomicrobia bacterium]|nr:MAG: hypothetical protein EAZ42_02965 [Verrucomicrobiota bacterium]